MIITAIINLVYNVLIFILSPISSLPDATLNSNITSSLATAGSYYHSLNSILPIDTMLVIFGVSLGIELGYFIYKAIMWVVKKIPGVN